MRKKPKLLVIGSLVMDLVTETAAFPAEGETAKAPIRQSARQSLAPT